MPSGSRTCRAECTYQVPYGTTVALNADNPHGQEYFNGWTVAGNGNSTCSAHVSDDQHFSCSVTVYGNTRVAVRYGGPEEPVSEEPVPGESSSVPGESSSDSAGTGGAG